MTAGRSELYLRAKAGEVDDTPSVASRILGLLILLLGLVTVAISVWGMAASIEATDSQVTTFWEIVDQIDGKVGTDTSSFLSCKRLAWIKIRCFAAQQWRSIEPNVKLYYISRG
jgi:hypothetical protein